MCWWRTSWSAAESSTGALFNMCVKDDFTKSLNALLVVYYINPDGKEMSLAYPTVLFDRMVRSFLALAVGSDLGLVLSWSAEIYGLGDVEHNRYNKTCDCHLPPAFLRSYTAPSVSVEASYAFWQGCEIKNSGNYVLCLTAQRLPKVVNAMMACIKETGAGK
ncbi:rbcL [Symbiodinium sp. CCMP2592]|nr:rbcL [Symbiodinium sp. CCMP2592]